MKFFGINSRLYKFMDTLWTVLKLNFIWVIFSLPIVTIGPSTIAAFSVTLKMAANEEGKIFSQFFKSFKQNFKQGLIIGLITLAVAYSCYLNFEFFNKLEGNPIIFLIAGIVILFIGLANFTYVYPLLARYDNSIMRSFKLSREITYKYFLRTILLWILVAFINVLFLFTETLYFVGLLIGPATIFYTISGFSRRIFNEIEKENLSG
ncbi:MAG TPA: DUF624 domain-containing protein [Acholeplasmataceae bacterium]|nr:DUF624 domain-containing protein [Acholeplasmataceae bacterium]